MEMHQQELQGFRPNFQGGLKDTMFATSTLSQKGAVPPRNTTSTRASQGTGQAVSTAKSGRRAAVSEDDNGDESDDPIDFLGGQLYSNQMPPVPREVISRKSRKVSSAQGSLSTKKLGIKARRPAVKKTSSPELIDLEPEDNKVSPLFSGPVTPPKKVPRPKQHGRKAGATTKRKRPPVPDIKEISNSDSENSESSSKSHSGKVSFVPRPFPMDLSPPRKVQEGVKVSPSISKVKKVVGSSPRSNMRHSSFTESGSDGEANLGYTQAVEMNEVDPSTLCPFCDEKMPEDPSDLLKEMLAKLKTKAKPDKRYGNALGLKLDMSLYTPFCVRHEAETNEFPRGKRYGWPTELKHSKLAKRIKGLEASLKQIIDDPKNGTFFFPLQERAKQLGKHAVVGAKGSWATFENASTGYYGEQGFAVITQVMYDMFPSLPSEKIAPLELSSYYSLVLVPETALLLIKDDLEKQQSEPITRAQAHKVLRKSTKYGLARFPVGEGDQEVAGDNLARQRAVRMRRLREKEYEEEELKSSQPSSRSSPLDGVLIDLSSDSAKDEDAMPTPKPKKHLGKKRQLAESEHFTETDGYGSTANEAYGELRTVAPRPKKGKVNLSGQPDAGWLVDFYG